VLGGRIKFPAQKKARTRAAADLLAYTRSKEYCAPSRRETSHEGEAGEAGSAIAEQDLLIPMATVRDAIGDLADVAAGAPAPVHPYTACDGSSSTHVTGQEGNLYDEYTAEARQMHCALPLNTIELKRLQHVPVGGDWRDLPFKTVYIAGAAAKTKKGRTSSTSSGTAVQNPGSDVQLIQRWLVASAKDNGEWKDCYGRLRWDGTFSTVTTDPTPTAKMGRVVHPRQVSSETRGLLVHTFLVNLLQLPHAFLLL
jgi:hypothetical protein